MQARLKNPVLLIPGTLQAMLALDKSTETADLPYVTRKLVHLRASQINGCSVCIDMHARELKKAGEKDERVFTVSAWRETPYFTDAERAALALAEATTRLCDRPDPVPHAIWDEAARHYDEKALAALVIQIALINAFNRLNAATRQTVGAWGVSRTGSPICTVAGFAAAHQIRKLCAFARTKSMKARSFGGTRRRLG